MNLYRLRYLWKSGGASSGETEYYESLDKLKVDLLRHQLDIVNESRDWKRGMMASLWRKHKFEDSSRRTTKIVFVEQAIDNEWKPMTFTFVEPDVLVNE